MIFLLALATVMGAPPKHLTKSWKSASASKNCGLILFYSARLKRYRHEFSKPHKKLIKECTNTLFPKKLYWFKSSAGEFRFGYPKKYIRTPKIYASIPKGHWWHGWVPALRPLSMALKKEAEIAGKWTFSFGKWKSTKAFRITVHEISKKEFKKGALGHQGAPAVKVSFSKARSFCQKLGGDLPTEVQWEIAARGGEYYLVYSWGEAVPSACFKKSGPECGAVKQRIDASIWGVRNLSSSVAEWVLSGKGHNLAADQALTKGGGDTSHWFYNLVPTYQVLPKNHRSKSVGFRCVFPAGK